MRLRFANWLAFGIGAAIIVLSLVFAWIQSGG